MRTYLKILFILVISAYSGITYAGSPVAIINYAAFTTSNGKNYFETYLSVIGSSLKYVKNSNNKFVAKAHVTLSFTTGDSIVSSANYNVVGPEISDTSVKPDFIDVHRFFLKKGSYTLVFTIDDPNDPEHAIVSGKQPVHTGYPDDAVSISDAEFLTSFTESTKTGPDYKYGYEMTPYVYSYYPAQVKKLGLYCEIYNTNKFAGPNEKVLIKYSIEDEGNYFLDYSQNFSSSTTMDADSVIPFMAQIPIENLASGYYSLKITVIDKNYHTLATRKFSFSRENPAIKSSRIPSGFAPYFANRDTLVESIHCLGPLSTPDEKDIIDGDSLRQMNTDELKRFFYFFWEARDTLHPLDAWQKYLSNVILVNNSFSVPGLKGYRTDRGRVYLHYGAPNHRIVSKHNPSTYPYEIWHYYTLPDGQVDIRFVFYDRDLVTNNYILLQSTAIGETQNPQWQVVLYSRLGTSGDVDTQQIQDDLGENLNDEYNDPH